MADYIEFIPKSGACVATTNVLERRGLVRWMVRVPSTGGADNVWRIMSHIDTREYLQDKSNWQIVAFNDVCNIEPALIGVYDTPAGRRIPVEEFYVPPQFRA